MGLLPGSPNDSHQLSEVVVALEDREEELRRLTKLLLGQTLVAVRRLPAERAHLVVIQLQVGLGVVDAVAELELVGIGWLDKNQQKLIRLF